MTDLPPTDLPNSLTDILHSVDAAEGLDHAHLLAEVINLYHEACRRTRLGTKLSADDIGKIMTIFNLLTKVGMVEKGIAELVGRPQRSQP